jgi:hypothetical protein
MDSYFYHSSASTLKGQVTFLDKNISPYTIPHLRIEAPESEFRFAAQRRFRGHPPSMGGMVEV